MCKTRYFTGAVCPYSVSFALIDVNASLNPIIDKVPHIKSNPTVAVSHQNGRIVYICKYDVDPSAGAFNAEISWYHGSSKKEIYKENFQPWRGQASLQNREGSKAIIRLGTVVSLICIEIYFTSLPTSKDISCNIGKQCTFL